MSKTINCNYCQATFKGRNNGKFCSYDCHRNFIKSQRIVVNCQYCNKERSVKPSKKDTALFCDRACMYLFKAGIITENEIKKKLCSHCNTHYPLDMFSKDTRGRLGVRSECKKCATLMRGSSDISKSRKEYSKIWRRRDLEKHRKNQRERIKRIREEVLSAYGSKCVCCGEAEVKFLAIDHIYNDGSEDRRRVGTGISLYSWLKRNNFPKDRYQILCHNCNMAKAFYGECPHKHK